MITEAQVKLIMEILNGHEDRLTDLENAAKGIRNAKTTLEAWIQANRMYREGDSIACIARALNRPRSSIQNMLKLTREEAEALGYKKPPRKPRVPQEPED